MNTPTNLKELLQSMRANDEGLGDWTSLPTFGGAEPANTMGVWSWDETSLIVGTCADDVKIITRDDYCFGRIGLNDEMTVGGMY